MMPFTDFTGLLSSAIALSAVGVMLMPAKTSPNHRRWLASALFIAAFLPWNGAPLAIYPRGVMGDLSITSVMLLLLATAVRIGVPMDWYAKYRVAESRLALLAMTVLLALVLYPMALGWGLFDPYRLGYASLTMMLPLSVVASVALWMRQYLVTIAIALAIATWSMGWYESTNLWDYLLDPLVALYAAGACIKACCRYIRCTMINPRKLQRENQ